MVKVTPEGFWGSFGLLPWVVWGTACSLSLLLLREFYSMLV